MGTHDGAAALVPRGVRRGMGLVIVLVWTGWAVAVLVAPILRHAEGGLWDGAAPSALLQRGGVPGAGTGGAGAAAAGGRLVSVPVRLPRRARAAAAGPAKLARIVRQLADLYAPHCACAGAADCPCAAAASTAVAAALDNAVDREFAPPNMYYRSRDGYAFRLRGFQAAKTHMNGGLKHDKFLDLHPMTARWQEPRPPAPAPAAAPKKERTGLKPIRVQGRFVSAPGADTYASAHFVRKATDDDVVAYPPQTAGAAARGQARLAQQQTTQLWEFNYVPLADEEFPGKHPTVFEQQALKEAYIERLQAECKEGAERCMATCKEDPEACKEFSNREEEEEEEEGGGVGSLDDELDELDAAMKKLGVEDYSKMLLTDSELEAAKAKSGIPPENDAAFEIPYQEGEEVDWADWLYAFDDDAVRPLRLVEGESNFPEMDANINAPGAVLEDFPGQAGGGESYASFLKHPAGEGGEMQADASSVNGWLTDDGAY